MDTSAQEKGSIIGDFVGNAPAIAYVPNGSPGQFEMVQPLENPAEPFDLLPMHEGLLTQTGRGALYTAHLSDCGSLLNPEGPTRHDA